MPYLMNNSNARETCTRIILFKHASMRRPVFLRSAQQHLVKGPLK